MNTAFARPLMFLGAIALTCGGAGAQSTSAPQAAQQQTQQVPASAYGISGWQLQCNTQGSALSCQVLDSVAARSNGSVIAAVSIRMQPDGKTPALFVQTPLGVAVDEPIRVGIDGGASQTFAFLTCVSSGCLGRATLSDALLSAMRTSAQPLRLTFVSLDNNANKQTINISLGLDGFAAAYAKLK